MSIKDIENAPKLPENVRKLRSFWGFYELYRSYLATCKYNYEAFDKANEQYKRIFGGFKYVDYHTFRKTLKRELEKRRG